MALPRRTDPASTAALHQSPPLADASRPGTDAYGFQPGGQVGQMHADLAARLARGFADTAPTPAPGERFVRLASVAGGYAALAAAYAGIAFLFLR